MEQEDKIKKRFGYQTADKSTYKLLKDHAARMKKFPTEAESLLWEQLKGSKLGYKFRRQHPILDYIPDFVSLPLHIIIEVDGGYHMEGEQPQRDAERTKLLEKEGYTIVRFTNQQVLSDLESVIKQIQVAIKEQIGY